METSTSMTENGIHLELKRKLLRLDLEGNSYKKINSHIMGSFLLNLKKMRLGIQYFSL